MPTTSSKSEGQRLTARVLQTLSPTQIARDNVVRGLFAECGRSGTVSLKIQSDLRHGPRNGAARKPVSIRITLGRFPQLTLEAARTEAMRLLAEIRAGRDPRPQAEPPAPQASVWTVRKMFDEYALDLATREKAPRTIADQARLSGYLSDWMTLPITSVTRQMARERHRSISTTNGKIVANHCLKAFRTCFNFAKAVHDTPLGENPVDAVTFNPERSRNRSLAPVDLKGWHLRLQDAPNPLRRLMHEVGLFLGLRPSNLVGLRKEWLLLDQQALVIPAEFMKGRREFSAPLSLHVVGLIRRALVLSNELSATSPWLFPTRGQDGSIICTQVWKERQLPGETGHLLRHTYSNVAHLAGVEDVDRELLLAHKVPGVKGTYLHSKALFPRLLEAQERISAYLLTLIA